MLLSIVSLLAPCIAIYLVFKFVTFSKILRILETWEHKARSKGGKPGVGTFLLSWIVPLLCLLGYKNIVQGAELDFPLVITYAVILFVGSAIGFALQFIVYKRRSAKEALL